jgi:hypothetical protein
MAIVLLVTQAIVSWELAALVGLAPVPTVILQYSRSAPKIIIVAPATLDSTSLEHNAFHGGVAASMESLLHRHCERKIINAIHAMMATI